MHARILAGLAMSVALLTAPSAVAQDETVDAAAETPAALDAPARRLTVDLGAEVTTTYFWRGRVIQDQGFIFQPYGDFTIALADGDDGPSLDLYLGNWNSFDSQHTAATSDTGVAAWNESDFYGGVRVGWDWVALDVGYMIYTYPNSDFNTVQELGVGLVFDLPDDGIGRWIGDVSATVAMETHNSNVAASEASYLELGFGPSFDVANDAVTLSVPVRFGLSLDDYFQDLNGDDEFFGFAEVGVAIEWPFASGAYGDWTLTGGVNFAFLGSAMQEQHPTGDDTQIYGFIGVGLSF